MDFKSLDLEGSIKTDNLYKSLYATDASAYQEEPLGVAFPKTESDLQKLVFFAKTHRLGLIPRTAGTSLAGQVVGKGLVVDMSRYMTEILHFDKVGKTVTVQPGVIRNELTIFLKPHDLYFGPETSTANRAMIGGMVGNNSCGSNSLVYGSTRDHLLKVKAFLSDGTEVVFEAIDKKTFFQKTQLQNLEGKLYRHILEILSHENNQKNISSSFPKPNIPRRNTGYAIDLLLDNEVFDKNSNQPFNFCKLIAGSEGTLALLSELTLALSSTPPPEHLLVCAHFASLQDSLKANLIALKFKPHACELIDHHIISCAKNNREQAENAFFVNGKPEAILVVDLRHQTHEEVEKQAHELIAAFKKTDLGYAFPIIPKVKASKVWELRKAGLGLLSNMPGDTKPVAVIEDTCVTVEDLPAYIADFNRVLKKYDLYCVHYAHAGSGELHLRPLINLKTPQGNALFKTIAQEIATLVKKYKGSLSGEHGDGRLRGEFIPFMIGESNYALYEDLKKTWDKQNIFNPNKIVNTPPMNTGLRYRPNQETPTFDTLFDFSATKGLLRAAEMCNGSGDCRKTEITGGTMCPSYMASKNEKDTTRARANILRSILTKNEGENPFDNQELKEVMKLCLSCKGCKSECPSNVDIAKMKAEFLYQMSKTNPVSLRTWLIANFGLMNAFAAQTPKLYNFIFGNQSLAQPFKKILGFSDKRSMPLLAKTTLRKWYQKSYSCLPKSPKKLGKVYLFCDEFTNYNDVAIGIKTIKLLNHLGYEVIIPKHLESGRTYLSKGLLEEAKHLISKNVELLSRFICPETPMIGIEPSTLLTFRDEALELIEPALKEKAKTLAKSSFLLEEFLAKALEKGAISPESFTDKTKTLKIHVHCYQKALTPLTPIRQSLNLLKNYKVQFIRSGCCGMAGSFGYEKENYDLSMKVANLVLLPTLEKTPEEVLVVANGTSCRHQIKDGIQRKSYHIGEILFEGLKK